MTLDGAARTSIKICGLSRASEVVVAAESGADLVGFVLAPRSPRAIPLEEALALAEVARGLGVASVALVVDPGPERLAALAAFDRVQFHGDERCEALASSPRPTIRGFAYSAEALRRWEACGHADWLLVDGASGGGGRGFDHTEIAALRPSVSKPILLAGGLDAENVALAITRVRPFGVDVSSGVEAERGRKDPERIRRFCAAVREADLGLERARNPQRPTC